VLDEQAQPDEVHSDGLDALSTRAAGVLYCVRVDRESMNLEELPV
jgi:hypothetical protein